MAEDISNEKKKDTKKKIRLSVRIYSLFEDLASFAVWFLLINKVAFQNKFAYDFLYNIFSSDFYLLLSHYRTLIILGLFVLSICIFGIKNTLKRITLFLWHIILFPLIIILQIIFIHTPRMVKITGRLFGFINLAINKIVATAQKTWIYLVCFLIAFLCFYLIGTSPDRILIIISMNMLFAILALHLLYLFVWTSNPYSVFDTFYNIIETIWKQLKKYTIYEQYLDKKEHKNPEKEKQDVVNFLETSIKVANKIREKTIVLTDNRALISWFMAIFLTTIVFTVLVFSFEYYGLTSLGINFTVLQKGQYFEHLYYSVSILSTIDSVNILPITRIAKIFIMIEVFSGIFLLILIVTAFSTITKEAASEGRRKLIERIDKEIQNMQNIAKEKLQVDISRVIEANALPTGNKDER